MSFSGMAFTCSSTINHNKIHGHDCSLRHCRNMHAFSSINAQKHPNHLSFTFGYSSSAVDNIRCRPTRRVALSARLGEGLQENSTDSREESPGSLPKEATQVGGSEAPSGPSPSPFVGAKISSRIAARTAEASNATTTASIPAPATSMTSPSSKFSGGAFTSDLSSLSAVEKLKNARPSVFTDSGARSKGPGSQNLLDALRQTDLGGKTTKFGQPVVPTNLFDEPKKVTADEKKFDFTLNSGQLILVFSFLTIIGIMFGTAFLVWKVGGIHYNEY